MHAECQGLVICSAGSAGASSQTAKRSPNKDVLKKFIWHMSAGLKVYAGMIDAELDERGYIVPGLGDAGDRAFGTA